MQFFSVFFDLLDNLGFALFICYRWVIGANRCIANPNQFIVSASEINLYPCALIDCRIDAVDAVYAI